MHSQYRFAFVCYTKSDEIFEVTVMKYGKKNNYKKGFTLVEVIVVLVILAILAAILIPSLTGWIKKSNQKAAISECRQCVLAAQTLASEKYGKGDPVGDSATAGEIKEIADLAETNGNVNAVEYSSSKVSKLIYVSQDEITVTYLKGKYTVGEGSSSLSYSSLKADPADESEVTANFGIVAGMFKQFLAENLPSGATLANSNINLTASNPYISVYVNGKSQKIDCSSFVNEFRSNVGNASEFTVYMNASGEIDYMKMKGACVIKLSGNKYYTSSSIVYYSASTGKVTTVKP